MSKALIVHASKTGYSKKYADWIAEELDATSCSLKDISDEEISKADVIIFGSGVNGSIMNDQTKFARKMKRYPDKKIIYFATGVRPSTERTLDLIRKNNFGSEPTTCFYFRGGIDYENLKPGDKTLIKIYSMMVKRQRDTNDEEKQVMELLKQKVDFSSHDQIEPLVNEVLQMS